MKEMAFETAASVVYDPADDVLTRAENMKYIVSSNALLYILDPLNQDLYRDRIRDTLLFWSDLSSDPASLDPDHDYTVGTGSAFFNSVLALDIIHDDLTLAEVVTIEAELQVMADWFEASGLANWSTNGYGCLVIWGAYSRDRELLDQAKSKYREELFAHLLPSGVFIEATQYSKARFASDRDAKVYTMDVLEFTGEDSYYDDPQLRGLYEWIYGGGTSSSRINATFGDSSPRRKVDVGPRTYNMHKFSNLAAQHAAWVLNGAERFQGELLYYVLMDQALPEAKKPMSRVWPDSYASFWEDRPDDSSLMIALASIDGPPGDHSHKDVNSVYFSAYGESMLLNSGYSGWQKGLDTDGDGLEDYSWSWIHDNARSSNTGSIDRVDHVSKRGGGIQEALLADGFDYASADSGPAIAEGQHFRNLCFVHPRDGKNGYAVLFDEFSTTGGQDAFLFLHPDSTIVQEEVPNALYTFTVQRRNDVPSYLSILLATPPVAVDLENGGLGVGRDSIDGVFIDAQYEGSPSNYVGMVSVLFPHDATHAVADLEPTSGSGYTGALIDHGDSVIDIALDSDSALQPVRFGMTSFMGESVLFREIGAQQQFYFVRQGTRFEDGANNTIGFSSTQPITIFMEGLHGSLLSGISEITFYYPGIRGVLLNGAPATVTSAGPGFVTIQILFQVDSKSKKSIELLVD